MDDLGGAVTSGRRTYMLGGGNPALIPEMAVVWRDRMRALLEDAPAFDRVVGSYDAPQGRPAFLKAAALMLRAEYGWPVTERNVAVTNGSQAAFFMLFTLLAGLAEDGSDRRILFPLLPEYIGYRDQALGPDDFVAALPVIDRVDPHRHKYRIDFDSLPIDERTAAICVSRPTNPSGNVLTGSEIGRLDSIARSRGIPLLIDNAYGTPFPNIVFTDAEPVWNENIVLSMSLSKIGLPSLRTGILVANEELVRRIGGMNAILSLANGTVGQALTEALFANGEILRLSRQVVQPFYRGKRDRAVERVSASFGERFPWSLHEPEGSFFLWLWFPELPETTDVLYERLKERGVIVVPGEYFAFGGHEGWDHCRRCVRVNYAMDDADVAHGIGVIGEEVGRMWGQ